MTADGFYDVVVTQRRQEAAEVVSLHIAAANGLALPDWQPGAHIDIRLPSGAIRQYSLCGPIDDDTYRVAVLREANGRGGSAEVHDKLRPGDTLSIRGPRNQFPLVDADNYLLLAGGIGVTPILAMARELAAAGKPWQLFYGGRSHQSMAFVDELKALDGAVHIVDESEYGLLDLPSILGVATPETAIYCCGPPGMITHCEASCAALSLDRNLHTEHFTAPSERVRPVDRSPSSFEVELHRTGHVLTVSSGQSILGAVREVLPDVAYSCQDGYCGTCETTVLDGVPEHHDDFLTESERESNETMMICVGRSKTPRLVLDL